MCVKKNHEVSLAEASRKTSEALQRITANWCELFHALNDRMSDAVALLSPLVVVPQWRLAYIWAKAARPKWVAILDRTKKRRTRKKYRDRIMRAYYVEVVDHGDAETN